MNDPSTLHRPVSFFCRQISTPMPAFVAYANLTSSPRGLSTWLPRANKSTIIPHPVLNRLIELIVGIRTDDVNIGLSIIAPIIAFAVINSSHCVLVFIATLGRWARSRLGRSSRRWGWEWGRGWSGAVAGINLAGEDSFKEDPILDGFVEQVSRRRAGEVIVDNS